jgi:hypothetical protein
LNCIYIRSQLKQIRDRLTLSRLQISVVDDAFMLLWLSMLVLALSTRGIKTQKGVVYVELTSVLANVEL